MHLDRIKNEIENLQRELDHEKGIERNLIEEKYSEELFKLIEAEPLTQRECLMFVKKLIDEIHKLETRY